ncbi:MAG TPA: phage portal protein, partial [Phycisphaerae bacterium]|nr:phage portal protein [Phycisphaerae bacterium]
MSRRGAKAKPIWRRIAEAAGEAAGRHLAQRPTGRLDATWSARNSGTAPAYQAAAVNRSTADWRTGLTSATQAILEGLDTMLARSRWLIRNDGYMASAQGAYRRKVVGGGITARAAARHPESGVMLKSYNRQHDLLWRAWAMDPRLCDVEQTKCLYEKQAVWMDELFAAGGVLLRAVYTP